MFVCDHCRRAYKTEANLKRHTKERHTELRHYRCIVPLCKGKFIRRSYLITHLVNLHGYAKTDAKTIVKSVESVTPTTKRVSASYSELEDISDSELPSSSSNGPCTSSYTCQFEDISEDEETLFDVIDSYSPQTHIDSNNNIVDELLDSGDEHMYDSGSVDKCTRGDSDGMFNRFTSGISEEINASASSISNEKGVADNSVNGDMCTSVFDNSDVIFSNIFMKYLNNVNVDKDTGDNDGNMVVDNNVSSVVSDNGDVSECDVRNNCSADDIQTGSEVEAGCSQWNANDRSTCAEGDSGGESDFINDDSCNGNNDVNDGATGSDSDVIIISSDEEYDEIKYTAINVTLSKTEKIRDGNVVPTSRNISIGYANSQSEYDLRNNLKDIYNYIHDEFTECARCYDK